MLVYTAWLFCTVWQGFISCREIKQEKSRIHEFWASCLVLVCQKFGFNYFDKLASETLRNVNRGIFRTQN